MMRDFSSGTRLWRRIATRGALCATAVAAVAPGVAIPAGAATVNQNANNIIIGSGSSTTFIMMQGLDQLFTDAQTCPMTTANSGLTAAPLDFACIQGGGGDPLALNASPTNTPENPWADVAVEEPPIGSSSGIGQLEKASGQHATAVNVATNINFARSSRAFTSSDYTGLNFVAYAEDSVSWFHFTTVPGETQVTTETNGQNAVTTTSSTGGTVPTPSASITNLTSAQLRGIYTGTYTNWDQLPGGTNAPIVVFAPQEGSGTQSTMKTFLGTDESASSNSVNCSSPAATAGGTSTGCTGPVVIFENELSALNSSTFIGNQASQFLPTIGSLGVAGNSVQDHRTTTVAASGWKGAGSLAVTSLTQLATHNLITIAGVPGAYRVASTTPAVIDPNTHKVTSPARVTFVAGQHLAAAALSGVSIKWISWSTAPVAQTTATHDEAIRADGIFIYSFGKWSAQTHAGQTGSGASATLNTANCQTENCGSANLPAGYTATLGNLNGSQLNDYNTIASLFPASRYLYNAYSNGANTKIPTATASTLNYVSEAGFICKPQNASLVDPNSGKSYLSEIQGVIEAQGFFPISAGASSGTVNTTPGDEGSVSNPVSNMTLTATGSVETGTGAQTPTTNDYSAYMNVPSTGLAGGYQTSNGDPSGFCLVSSTDANANS